MRKARLTAILGGVLAAAPGPAAAQPQPAQAVDVKAVSLFKEGRALMEQGRHAEACPKLEESYRIDPGMGTLYNLSGCYEQIGRTASAWAGYRDVAAAADAAGLGSRAQAAREKASALEPKLSKVRLRVSPEAAAAGVEVQRNGVIVGRLLWGTDLPVDPGTYLLSASAEGRLPWSTTVIVKEPGSVSTIDVPPLPPVKAAAQPAKPEGPMPKAPSPGQRSVLPAVLLGSLGAAGVGGGIALLVGAGSRQAEALRLRDTIPTNGSLQDNACLAAPTPAGCAELQSEASTAATLRALSIVAFVLGGAGTLGMATYLVLPRGAPPPAGLARSIRILPAVDSASGSILIVGTF